MRQSGLLGVTDTISSFGLMPRYSLIWSLSDDPKNPNQAKALLRGATNISIGTVAKDMARGWHCVHSSANAIEPARTMAEPSFPTASASLDNQPTTDRPRLPPVKPTPPSAAEVKASSMLGQTKGVTAAPKWAISPINDFDRLSFILTPTDLPKPTPIPSEHPPELPTDLSQPKTVPPLPRKSFVKALKSAFAKIGLTHAIDENGRLILNKASGIKFPSGEGNLSKASLPRARNMLLLAELPETAATARLAVVGYSTPSQKMNQASTQQANKKISRIRAELIREIITEFNIWPPDQISIDGLGNVNPIHRSDRGQGECGAYDCDLSRRVEVSPIFKEQPSKN
jgi:flagellar motor protein MotB